MAPLLLTFLLITFAVRLVVELARHDEGADPTPRRTPEDSAG